MTDISIVIPIFNEEDNIEILFNEISKISLKKLNMKLYSLMMVALITL